MRIAKDPEWTFSGGKKLSGMANPVPQKRKRIMS